MVCVVPISMNIGLTERHARRTRPLRSSPHKRLAITINIILNNISQHEFVLVVLVLSFCIPTITINTINTIIHPFCLRIYSMPDRDRCIIQRSVSRSIWASFMCGFYYHLNNLDFNNSQSIAIVFFQHVVICLFQLSLRHVGC